MQDLYHSERRPLFTGGLRAFFALALALLASAVAFEAIAVGFGLSLVPVSHAANDGGVSGHVQRGLPPEVKPILEADERERNELEEDLAYLDGEVMRYLDNGQAIYDEYVKLCVAADESDGLTAARCDRLRQQERRNMAGYLRAVADYYGELGDYHAGTFLGKAEVARLIWEADGSALQAAEQRWSHVLDEPGRARLDSLRGKDKQAFAAVEANMFAKVDGAMAEAEARLDKVMSGRTMEGANLRARDFGMLMALSAAVSEDLASVYHYNQSIFYDLADMVENDWPLGDQGEEPLAPTTAVPAPLPAQLGKRKPAARVVPPREDADLDRASDF
jgi:hypothetical protein